MYAVEFQAKVKNGSIEIPEEYKTRFKERVRVILLAEEENTAANFIDQLLQHPITRVLPLQAATGSSNSAVSLGVGLFR